MGRLSKLVGVVAVCLGLIAAAQLRADTPVAPKPDSRGSDTGKFIRIRRDSQGQPLALETAIVRYVPASGEGKLTVDLVSAVHIGDRDYYARLNQQFEQYDVLLYELVAQPGTRIPRGGKRNSENPIALLQQLMKSVLNLESQTEQIDYTRKHFVHADLSPEGMAEAIRKRGDDGFTLFLSITADLLRQQNLQELQQEKKPGQEEEEPDVLSLLLDPDASIKLKRLLAQQMEAIETPAGGLGKTLNTILITDRNQAALKVFQTELAKGKKKIGIFYGAGHMPDFDKQLRQDFGLKRAGETWLTAWDLRSRKSGLLDFLKLLDP